MRAASATAIVVERWRAPTSAYGRRGRRRTRVRAHEDKAATALVFFEQICHMNRSAPIEGCSLRGRRLHEIRRRRHRMAAFGRETSIFEKLEKSAAVERDEADGDKLQSSAS